MRRIERLINLIAALLETAQPLTSSQIRERIAGYDQESQDAFRRAFERDKESLRAIGIPLELREMGPYGDEPEGYIIPKEKYYLPELDLEPQELAALRIAAGAVLGAGAQATSGLMKLSLDLPGENWDSPRVVWGTDLAAEQPLLGPLYASVTERKPVKFDYSRADGPTAMRSVEPYGLVHRRGNWYVVGRDRDKDAVRAFKVSRIGGRLESLDGTYPVPDDFDPASHVTLEGWEIGGEASAATVRFSPELRWWAEQNLKHASVEGPDGSLDVELPVSNPDALISWVIGFSGKVEIVAPPEARSRLRAHLEAGREALGV
ncbi:MAG TPA: WYL domain-containing protein [Actinomycetota bacterium]|nr:WYL domain-containing protein [Actinomycetota bacterium]